MCSQAPPLISGQPARNVRSDKRDTSVVLDCPVRYGLFLVVGDGQSPRHAIAGRTGDIDLRHVTH